MLYYLSSEKMTVCVTVEDGVIVKTPPIVRKFKGQPIDNLINWMRKQKNFKYGEIKKNEWI